MPPDSSCGYWRSRASGSGMPHGAQHLERARPRRRRASSRPRSSTTSVSCRPMRRCGVSAFIGSWNTSADAACRARRRSASLGRRRAVPARRSAPSPRAVPFAASSPRHAEEQLALAGARLADDRRGTRRAARRATRPRTACTVAARRGELDAEVADLEQRLGGHRQRCLGSSASRRPSPRKLRHSSTQRQHGRRHQQQPRRGLHLERALGDQPAEAGERLLHAEAEEAQEALEQDHLRHRERRVDDHRAEHVRHDVARDDACAAAGRARSRPRRTRAAATRAPGRARCAPS